MTQSGQGEEPSRRPAREGIVLPSDGGEPLLPGPANGTAGHRAGGPAPSSAPAAAPAGGQAWDQPWGPDRQHNPAPGQGWGAAPGQSWGTPETAQQAPAAQPPADGPGDWSAPGPAQPPAGGPSVSGPGPLPPEGAQPPAYGTQPSYGAQPPAAYGGPQAPYAGHGQPAGPPPGRADEGATQYIPPVTAPADDGATRYIPPVAASADEGATQYIPPVAPGALPPENAAGPSSEDTRMLRRPAQPGPLPPASGPASGPDAEATQYIAPVPGQTAGAPFGTAPGGDAGRQPPAEFDNLFRSGPGGDHVVSATQQLPVFDEPARADRPGYVPQGPGGGGGRRRAGHGGDGGRGGRGGRTGSRVPLLAAIGVGLAVVGVGAGALLAGGGGEERADDAKEPLSATAPVTETSASPSPTVDPAEEQAVELDKLLADSGNSRTAVINAVTDVKSCDNLSRAAKDLRDAAKQRTGLVTRLKGLSVDELPDHAALTTALTKAWQASASADNHYAAWADQTAGKKGCKKGKARTTSQLQAGNRASGVASTEKAKAAKLWNKIARTYGLTEREPTQL
ncbi:hypothetical protein ACLGIH_18855 [Streptomyces sp. HMX87]|uniref:hypothetical protein n=1 Tax=Streptomyces sp. HMX87 TaxID=3390849 RepID=UPI003A866A7F